jgi:AcrR family transcriptional regulator
VFARLKRFNIETKQKILKRAVALFNRKGCIAVSMRTIAKACDMSLSNLQHHFKTKEILLQEIIEQMCLVFDGSSDFEEGDISLRILNDMNVRWRDFQRHYVFFFNEINSLLTEYPRIRSRFAEIKAKRIREYNSLFAAYERTGLFKPEPFPGFFAAQAELIWFTSNYYLATQLSDGKKITTTTFEEGDRLRINIIFPLLSDVGITELRSLR